MRYTYVASLAKAMIVIGVDDMHIGMLLGNQAAALVCRGVVYNSDRVAVFSAELLDTVDGINNFFATIVVNQNEVDPRCRLNDVIHG